MKLNTIIAVRADKTVYRDGDKAIKIFNHAYSKANVLNEALNQARVEETGLSVPKLHEVTLVEGKWAIVTDYIAGKTMSNILKEEPDRAGEMINLLADVQIEIHSKTAPMLNRLIDKMHRKICETDFDATVRYEIHMRLKSMPRHTKVCHGDFCPSNIILTPEGRPYVIDWAHATQGNSSADAARTYLVFHLNGEYELACLYLDKFCEKSGIDRLLVQKWLPIVAASQSVKKIPSEQEFLSGWINVVEYE